MSPSVLVATGLKREAALVASPQVRTVVGGGRRDLLKARLDAAQDGVKAVISVGIGGGLSPAVQLGDWVVADEIVDGYETLPVHAGLSRRLRDALERTAPPVHVGPIAAGGVIVDTVAAKAVLFARSGALAVDMESHVAARFAAERGLPFAAIRVISDPAHHALPPAAMVSMTKDGGLNLAAILRSVIRRPGQVPDLIATGKASEVAFAKLKLLGRDDLLGRLGVGDADLGQLALDVV